MEKGKVWSKVRGFTIWVISILATVILSKIVEKIGASQMKELLSQIYQLFVIGIWPVWVGLVVMLIYLFVMFLIDTHKKIKDLIKEVKTLKMSISNQGEGHLIEDPTRKKKDELFKRMLTGSQ